jgi:DNA segregation ATPase FtsK/SpoIIIE, S-DNA-T family
LEAAREHVKLAAARHAHAAAYHSVRAPAYVVLTAWWALVGMGRTVSLLLAWWHVPDLHRLERQAAADGLLSDHLRIHKVGREVRTARGLILAACAVTVVAALVVLSRAPARAWILLGAVALPLLARAGRPAGKPTVTGADPFRRSAGRHSSSHKRLPTWWRRMRATSSIRQKRRPAPSSHQMGTAALRLCALT